MDESGSGFRTQEGPPTNHASYNNNSANGLNNDSSGGSGGVRGVSEDLAWLLLYEISTALKYMHDRGKFYITALRVLLHVLRVYGGYLKT